MNFGLEEGSFCGMECVDDTGCPGNYNCEEVSLRVGGVSNQCLPASGFCDCSPYAVQISAETTCGRTDGSGTCLGSRVCTAGGLTDCDAPEPQTEECDGVDNNCNGVTDEGVFTPACEASNELGTCHGYLQCVEGEQVCDVDLPSPEGVDDPATCDGVDNDCNGTTDDGFLDTDQDGTADCVDPDDDDDGHNDDVDNCPLNSNADQKDHDLDLQGDVCDPDDDNDGINDEVDNCPEDPNEDQFNNDADELGDACDPDDDNDDVFDVADNCPFASNPDQSDVDGNGVGDACDGDQDGDGIPNEEDNCPINPNQSQLNTDGDEWGDVCDNDDDADDIPDVSDNCVIDANTDQVDTDSDGVGDACDLDDDGDGKSDLLDNCPVDPNPDQSDMDADNMGDICDPDLDGDSVDNTVDNCPSNANGDQADNDTDGIGDVCDPDDDNDGVPDGIDNCPMDANDQLDTDGNGQGDACDDDMDGDGVTNAADNCPLNPNAGQGNLDGDSQGDVCDPDKDGDSVSNDVDNCPSQSNGDQLDTDGDSLGDACDADDDDDGIPDAQDNCALVPNSDQSNYPDGDAFGDVCDPDDDNDGVADVADNCPVHSNNTQKDYDSDGQGDACDLDDDGDGSPDVVDCAPLDQTVYPGNQEVCNSKDDNCVFGIDEVNAFGCEPWLYDGDGDGWGAESLPGGQALSKCYCGVTGLYRANKDHPGDCNDNSQWVHPDATESCNNVDDNCDGSTDPENNNGADPYYYDQDEDDYGKTGFVKFYCYPTGNYTATQPGDCNDNSYAVNPGATETCNGVDDDCDSITDPAGSDSCVWYYKDADSDGYRSTSQKACLCGSSSTYPYTSSTTTDCCDTDYLAKPSYPSTWWEDSSNDCGSYDYNCDGSATKRWTTVSSTCAFFGDAVGCSSTNGWQSSAPACGATKIWKSGCHYVFDWFNSGCYWGADTYVKQECH